MRTTSRIEALKIRIRPVNPYHALVSSQNPPLTEWPRSSGGVSCWYCCHPFEWVPAFLPIEVDTEKGQYTFMGNFCSWNCVARYARDQRHVSAHSFIGILSYLTGPRRNVQCDPDLHATGLCDCVASYRPLHEPERREVLRMFGGTKTIDEFRQGFHCIQEYAWVEQHFVHNTNITDLVRTVERKRCWGFRHVYFPSPPELEITHVVVLPHTHRTIQYNMVQTGNEDATSSTTATTTTTDPSPAVVPPPRPVIGGPRRPRPSRGRAPSNGGVDRSTSIPPPVSEQTLAVNEEQAFFTKNLRKYGNLVDSMGITVSRPPHR